MFINPCLFKPKETEVEIDEFCDTFSEVSCSMKGVSKESKLHSCPAKPILKKNLMKPKKLICKNKHNQPLKKEMSFG